MTKPKPSTQTYTELSQDLASQLEQLERPDLDIDQAVLAYQKGLEIVAELESRILHAENRVSTLRAASTLEVEN